MLCIGALPTVRLYATCMHYVQRPEEGSTFSGTEVKRRLLAATWMLGMEYKSSKRAASSCHP